MYIRTVLGPIAPEDLGITLGHEHLLIDLRGLWDNPPPERAHLIEQEPTLENLGELIRNPYDSRPNLLIDDPELTVAELRRYRDAGGQALIDMTTVGIKPDPQRLCAIAQATEVHVVAGCGYYRQPLLTETLHDRSTEEIADDLLLWLNEGMYGTTIRAGLMGELGTSSPIYPFEERQLRAAAHVLDGHRVHTFTRVLVVPGSAQVKAQAEAEGLDRIFRNSGAEWRNSGCSMCLAMNPDVLQPGERCASTSNRNFEGRQGRGGRTHLVSPLMAAAAALAGHFVDAREAAVKS